MMWPQYVQGPISMTIIKNIPVHYPEKHQKMNIMIFGEEHTKKQCSDDAFDVIKNDNGDYVLTNIGSSSSMWTIGRLLYVLAVHTKQRIDYYFELRFREKRVLAGANMMPLFLLFQDCLGPSKEKCQFSKRVQMHAIDYRAWFERQDMEMFSADELHNLSYALVVGDVLLDEWVKTYKDRIWTPKDNDFFPTFDPTTPFQVFALSWGQYSSEFLNYMKTQSWMHEIVLRFFHATYGGSFDIADLILIYLDYKSDAYINFIENMLENLTRLLPRIESQFKDMQFDKENNSLASTAFSFSLNLVLMMRYSKIICERILQNNHPSVKHLGGRIVSRAAVQLQKGSRIFLDAGITVEEHLIDWIKSKEGKLFSGKNWRNWYPNIFENLRPDTELVFIQSQILNECLYFMDVPAIARMFSEPSSLKVFYAGDAHRQNIQSFFEFCRFSTCHTPAKQNYCLMLPDDAKDIINNLI